MTCLSGIDAPILCIQKHQMIQLSLALFWICKTHNLYIHTPLLPQGVNMIFIWTATTLTMGHFKHTTVPSIVYINSDNRNKNALPLAYLNVFCDRDYLRIASPIFSYNWMMIPMLYFYVISCAINPNITKVACFPLHIWNQYGRAVQ